MVTEKSASGRVRGGRAPATTHSQLSQIALKLFFERGFDQTTVDDIVLAAGIGRRTLFRYFPTKNDLPWGDFEPLLENMRAHFSSMGQNVPIIEALRDAVITFNRFPVEELPLHRSRMWLLLNVPALRAHSTLRYADWRQVIAEFVAKRRGEQPEDLTPQTVAWACLGICLGAYEQWLAHEDADLTKLFDAAFTTAEAIFGASTELVPADSLVR
jgi:mycofactocin system transcriptional regulator